MPERTHPCCWCHAQYHRPGDNLFWEDHKFKAKLFHFILNLCKWKMSLLRPTRKLLPKETHPRINLWPLRIIMCLYPYTPYGKEGGEMVTRRVHRWALIFMPLSAHRKLILLLLLEGVDDTKRILSSIRRKNPVASLSRPWKRRLLRPRNVIKFCLHNFMIYSVAANWDLFSVGGSGCD